MLFSPPPAGPRAPLLPSSKQGHRPRSAAAPTRTTAHPQPQRELLACVLFLVATLAAITLILPADTPRSSMGSAATASIGSVIPYAHPSPFAYAPRDDLRDSDSFHAERSLLSPSSAAASSALLRRSLGFHSAASLLHLPPWDGRRPDGVLTTQHGPAARVARDVESVQRARAGQLHPLPPPRSSSCSSVGPLRCCLHPFRFFVVPLPSVFNVGLVPDFARREPQGFGPGYSYPNLWNGGALMQQFSLEIVQGFWAASHPCRTRDPSEATFFLMPLWGFYLSRLVGSPKMRALRSKALDLVSCFLREGPLVAAAAEGDDREDSSPPAVSPCIADFWQFVEDQIRADWAHRKQLERLRHQYESLSPFPPAPSLAWDPSVHAPGSLSAVLGPLLSRRGFRNVVLPASRPMNWEPHPWAARHGRDPWITLRYEMVLDEQGKFDGVITKNVQVPVVVSNEATFSAKLLHMQWKAEQRRLARRQMREWEEEAESETGDSEASGSHLRELDPLLCGGLESLVAFGSVPANSARCSFGRLDLVDPSVIPPSEVPRLDEQALHFLTLQSARQRSFARRWIRDFAAENDAEFRKVIEEAQPAFRWPTSQSEEDAEIAAHGLSELGDEQECTVDEHGRDASLDTSARAASSRPSSPALSRALPSAALSRPILGLFFGSTNVAPSGKPTRLAVYAALHDSPDVLFLSATSRNLAHRGASLLNLYYLSRFCIILPGDSPSSKRLYDVIVAGCIPCFIDDRWGPTFSFLPWSESDTRHTRRDTGASAGWLRRLSSCSFVLAFSVCCPFAPGIVSPFVSPSLVCSPPTFDPMSCCRSCVLSAHSTSLICRDNCNWHDHSSCTHLIICSIQTLRQTPQTQRVVARTMQHSRPQLWIVRSLLPVPAALRPCLVCFLVHWTSLRLAGTHRKASCSSWSVGWSTSKRDDSYRIRCSLDERSAPREDNYQKQTREQLVLSNSLRSRWPTIRRSRFQIRKSVCVPFLSITGMAQAERNCKLAEEMAVSVVWIRHACKPRIQIRAHAQA